MKIGFLSNQLDNRGTGNALYNYAKYNESILGNESFILLTKYGNHNEEAKQRFSARFPILLEGESVKGLDALYHIKSGYNDGFNVDIPYLVHTVFDYDPHGTVYATISPWMGERFSLAYVPHIVEVHPTTENLREKMKIPTGAVVFGRYGGSDSFDISWVWDVIQQYTKDHPEAYFIFMNTDMPPNPWRLNKQIRVVEPTVNPELKKIFINTTDAMIHARSRGETFGIAVGEFAISGKPIITYEGSYERAHLQELGNFALTYTNPSSLVEQLDKVVAGPLVSWGYGQYTPENVMKKFDEVFLRAVH